MPEESKFQLLRKRESSRLQQGGQDLLHTVRTLTNSAAERDPGLIREKKSVIAAKENPDQGPDLGREEDTGLDQETAKTEGITARENMVLGAKKDELN